MNINDELLALLTAHARRLDNLLDSGVDPVDLSDSLGVEPIEIEVDVITDDVADGDRLILVGRVAPAWGLDTPEVEPGVELRLVRRGQTVAKTPVESGSAQHRIFEAHALKAHDAIVDDRIEQRAGDQEVS